MVKDLISIEISGLNEQVEMNYTGLILTSEGMLPTEVMDLYNTRQRSDC